MGSLRKVNARGSCSYLKTLLVMTIVKLEKQCFPEFTRNPDLYSMFCIQLMPVFDRTLNRTL